MPSVNEFRKIFLQFANRWHYQYRFNLFNLYLFLLFPLLVYIYVSFATPEMALPVQFLSYFYTSSIISFLRLLLARQLNIISIIFLRVFLIFNINMDILYSQFHNIYPMQIFWTIRRYFTITIRFTNNIFIIFLIIIEI